MSVVSMPLSSLVGFPVAWNTGGAVGPRALVDMMMLISALEDAGEDGGHLARGRPRAAADVEVAARGALADHGVAGPGADAAGGLAARGAREGRLLSGMPTASSDGPPLTYRRIPIL